MKKIKYLLLIAIISFFVMPNKISAGAPASLFDVVTLYGGVDGHIQTNEFIRGKSYNITTYSSGGYLYKMEYLTFQLDENIFEITNFFSNYGFEYNNGKIKLEGNKLLEEGFNTKYPTALWTVQVKLKDDAKLGMTKIDGISYEIVCAENEECGQENNNNDNNEIQKPSNSTQEDNNNNNIKDDNKNNNLTEEDKNTDTNEENNVNNDIILDDTKFYVLAGLLGIVVIEMVVLILRKTKKA